MNKAVEFFAPFIDPVDIFVIAAQHEVFLMAAHHQHLDGERVEIGGIELFLDLMHGLAQRAAEAQFFGKTDFFIKCADLSHLCAVRGQGLAQLGERCFKVAGDCEALHLCECVCDALCILFVFCQISFVHPQQEIFLAAAHAQRAAFNVTYKDEKRFGFTALGFGGIQRGVASEIGDGDDRQASERQPHKAGNAQGNGKVLERALHYCESNGEQGCRFYRHGGEHLC